jgi:chaperonin GroEL
VIDKDNMTIIGGSGLKDAIQGRCRDLRRQIDKSTSDYDKEKLQERLAKLSGGVAVIHVGAPSEVEMKNRKEAFDDAISATKAALAEGIVPGGGRALLHAVSSIESLEAIATGDERTGMRILRLALETPTRQIAENSGFDAGVVVDHTRSQPKECGFDAAKGTYVNLLESGIVDPTKVVRVALENAVSVAGVLLLTEATLTEIQQPESADHHAAAGYPE